MRVIDIILFISGVIGITISIIDLLSTHSAKISVGFEPVVRRTLFFLGMNIVGIVLVITGLTRHRKNRKFRKKVEDFY